MDKKKKKKWCCFDLNIHTPCRALREVDWSLFVMQNKDLAIQQSDTQVKFRRRGVQ